MKIILDAMGGDNAPQAMVQGALEAHKAQCGADIVLVGRAAEVHAGRGGLHRNRPCRRAWRS